MTRASAVQASTALGQDDEAGHVAGGGFPKTAVQIEHTKPGTVLDHQLRREQATALIALLSAHRERT